jgi:hypothetical protein
MAKHDGSSECRKSMSIDVLPRQKSTMLPLRAMNARFLFTRHPSCSRVSLLSLQKGSEKREDGITREQDVLLTRKGPERGLENDGVEG